MITVTNRCLCTRSSSATAAARSSAKNQLDLKCTIEPDRLLTPKADPALTRHAHLRQESLGRSAGRARCHCWHCPAVLSCRVELAAGTLFTVTSRKESGTRNTANKLAVAPAVFSTTITRVAGKPTLLWDQKVSEPYQYWFLTPFTLPLLYRANAAGCRQCAVTAYMPPFARN